MRNKSKLIQSKCLNAESYPFYRTLFCLWDKITPPRLQTTHWKMQPKVPKISIHLCKIFVSPGSLNYILQEIKLLYIYMQFPSLANVTLLIYSTFNKPSNPTRLLRSVLQLLSVMHTHTYQPTNRMWMCLNTPAEIFSWGGVQGSHKRG